MINRASNNRSIIHRMIKTACVVLLLIPTFLNGQSKNKNVRYGDKFFKVADYYLATEYYEKAILEGERTDYVHFKLGECNRLFYEYAKAELHYKFVVLNDSGEYPQAIYYYALMLKINGSYQESVDQFDAFLKTGYTDQNLRVFAQKEREGALYILDELKKSFKSYNFQNLGPQVNSKESDFAPSIYDNDTSIVISSARYNKKREETYGRLGGSFLDNYLFKKTSDSTWKEKNELNKFDDLNTKFHDGAGTFTADKQAYFFTRCDDKISGSRDLHCAIYVSRFLDGKWKQAEQLNTTINQPNTWNAHPSLSVTGDTLFFASKRQGGLGMTDIWYATKEGDDLVNSWQEAQNIGKPINTEKIDMSPVYNPKEKVLLFASNGHIGFGALDVFVAKGENLQEVKNLGLPFNSNYDDFHFYMGDSIGYVSSNRAGGIGDDDIYSFDLYTSEAHLADIEKNDDKRYDHVDMYGKISASGDADIKEVNIIVRDSLKNIIQSTQTDRNGEFRLSDINLQNDSEVIIDLPDVHLLSDYNYTVDSLSFAVKSSIVQVEINDSSLVDIGGVILDQDGKPVSGSKVILLDEFGNELMHTLTNDDGEFMFRSLDGSKEYTLKTEDDTFAISNVTTNRNKDVNRSSIKKADQGVASRIKAESIYFDYNSTAIRREANKTLKELSVVLANYPNVTLELHGYTDSKGSSSYNIELGKNRGLAALKVLEQLGINKSRIQVKTHGESEPIASNNTFEGRQLNRRVDFYILGGAKYEPKASVHILKPGTTLNEVAKSYDMTLEELKQLNNISTGNTKLKNYAPLRVKTGENLQSSQTSEDLELTQNTKRQISEEYIVKNDSYHNNVKYLAKPEKGYYLVLPKNTLYTISKICNRSVDDLIKLNNLKGNTILAGQVLQVEQNPTITRANYLESHATMLANAGITISQHQGEYFDLDGFERYVVKKGDTLNAIAKRSGVTVEKIKVLNNLTSDYIKPKMVLKLKEK